MRLSSLVVICLLLSACIFTNCTRASSITFDECKRLFGDANEDHVLFHSNSRHMYKDAVERIKNCKNLDLKIKFAMFTTGYDEFLSDASDNDSDE